MSNPWYTNSFSGQAGQTARAAQCNVQFQAIETAFDTIYTFVNGSALSRPSGNGIVAHTGSGASSARTITGTSPVAVTNGDGVAGNPTIAVSVMVASGASHASGLVPDPGAVAGTTKFLREDGSFAVPPSSDGSAAGNNTEVQFNNGGVLDASPNLVWGGDALFISRDTTDADSQMLDLTGSFDQAQARGLQMTMSFKGATLALGMYIVPTFSTNASTAFAGVLVDAPVSASGGSVLTAYGVKLPSFGGTTANYGFYSAQSGGSTPYTNWAIYCSGTARSRLGTMGVVLPAITGDPSALDSGQVWYDDSVVSGGRHRVCWDGNPYDLNGAPHTNRPRTSDLTLTQTMCGNTCTNTGAGGDIVLTLPSATLVGTRFRFAVDAAHYLKVKADGTDVIYNGASVSAAAGYIRSTTVGHTVEVEVVAAGKWMVMSLIGTWTVDS